MVEKNRNPVTQTEFFICSSFFHIYNGDGDLARKTSGEAMMSVEKYGLIHYYPIVLLHQTLCEGTYANYSEARKKGELLANMAESMGAVFLKGLAFMGIGQGYYRAGKYSDARSFVRKGIDLFSSEMGMSDYHYNFLTIIDNLISARLGDAPIREEELTAALLYSRQKKIPRMESETLLAMGIVNMLESDTHAAAEHFTKGLRLARENKHFHFVIIGPADAARACGMALELEVDSGEGYASHLLKTILAGVAEPELANLSRDPRSKVAAKAVRIRKAIHRSGTPGLRIQTLGGFQVMRGEKPIEEDEWCGVLNKNLLKTLLAQGSQGVVKDIVIESLWPEDMTKAVENKFKVSLHRLRKALEPDLSKTFGSSYIHLIDNLVSLDDELCRIDLNEFTDYFKRGRIYEQKGDMSQALRQYGQAQKMYKGDFLPDDLYVSWAEHTRRETKQTYLQILFSTAKIYEDRGTSTKAISAYREIIQSDPYSEAACQRLMVLLDQRGKRNEAVRIYHECAEALHNGLDTEPEQVTRAIYEEIKFKTNR